MHDKDFTYTAGFTLIMAFLLLLMASCSQPSGSTGELKAFCQEIVSERIKVLELEPTFDSQQLDAIHGQDSVIEETCPS